MVEWDLDHAGDLRGPARVTNAKDVVKDAFKKN